MSKFVLQEVEHDVAQAVERLAQKLISDKYQYVVGSVRRLPRIFDAILPEGSLRRELNRKLVYPSCVTLNPKMFEGCSVAVVDDCVQRGISLRVHLRKLRELKVSNITLFALANSSWHVEHGQFTGVHIHEPVLTLRPEDFSIVTSYINDVLRECPIPLDCEDRIIRVRLYDSSTKADQWLRTYAHLLGPIDSLPTPAHSQVRRYSQLLGANHSAVRALRVIKTPEWEIVLDEEVKLCWSTNQAGEIYCVPIALYRMLPSRSNKANGDMPSCLELPLRLFEGCDQTPNSLYESVVLWSSAMIAGFAQAALRARGADCDFEPQSQEFDRSYGQAGQQVYDWYTKQLQCAIAQLPDWTPGLPAAEQLPMSAYHENGSRIAKLLQRRYQESNRGTARLEWAPQGLSFSEIRSGLSDSLTPASLSAVLDYLLANCWLKALFTYDVNEPQTRYFSTELTNETSLDADLVSFSRPADSLKARHSRLVSQAVVEYFIVQGGADSGLLLGHFEHALSALVDALGKNRKDTVFKLKSEPHGVVVTCDTSNALVHGDGTIQQNQEILGIDIQNEGVRIRNKPPDPDDKSSFAPKALLLVREISEAARILSQGVDVSKGDAILYLGSCTTASKLFPVILENVRNIRDDLAPISNNRPLTEIQFRRIGDNVSGAAKKIELAARSRTVTSVLAGLASPSRMSPLFRQFVAHTERELCANAWLSVLEQIIAEAKGLFVEYRNDTRSRSLFEAEIQEPWADCQRPDVRSLYEEWSALVSDLGFISDSGFRLPYELLQRRFQAREVYANIGFTKIDAARHGQQESGEQKRKREDGDFPLFRSVAGFFHGVEARDPEGDAVVFAFSQVRNALRFAHAATLMCDENGAVAGRYRIATAHSEARFMEDGNVDSSSLDLIPEIEGCLKTLSSTTTHHYGANLGSLIDDGLWCVVRRHLVTNGRYEVGAKSYRGKRSLPGPVLYAISSYSLA